MFAGLSTGSCTDLRALRTVIRSLSTSPVDNQIGGRQRGCHYCPLTGGAVAKKAAPAATGAAPTLSLAEKGLTMTVPTNPEPPHSQIGAGSRSASAKIPRRGGVLVAAVTAVALSVVVLVLAVPGLAAPIGTAAGVVAVVVPLIQMMWRGGASGGNSADEP